MIGFSQRLQSLPGYPLAEIPTIKRRLIEAGVDVIDLGAGDNDTPPPEVAVDTMTEASETLPEQVRLSAGSARVPPGRLPLDRAPVWIRFDPFTEILPLIGSKEGLSHLPLAVINPGDVAIVPEPGYQAYLGGALLSGAEPYIAPLLPENDFLLELDQLPADICGEPKLSSSIIPITRQRPSHPRSILSELSPPAAVMGSCWRTTTRTASSPSTATARRASLKSPVPAMLPSSSSRSPRAIR